MDEQHFERVGAEEEDPGGALGHVPRMVTRMGLEEDLIAALDPERVGTGDDDRRRHGTDEGWHPPAAPDIVVYPRTTEECVLVARERLDGLTSMLDLRHLSGDPGLAVLRLALQPLSAAAPAKRRSP